MKQFAILFICAFFLAATSFAQEVNPMPTTTINVHNSNYDFGKINQGDVAKHEYTFTNTGDIPLSITNAKGSCGCTVPEWPKEPIMPGESGIIVVEFDSKGKKGLQSKRVTLYANTDPVQTFLTITGEILTEETEEEPTEMADRKTPMDTDRKDPIAKDCFAIFPNPTSEVLKLELNEHQGESADIKILDSNGRVLATRIIQEITGLLEFQVMDYAAGTYYVHIQIGNATPSTKCFVVARR